MYANTITNLILRLGACFKPFKHSSSKPRWICCSEPFKDRTCRKHMEVWLSFCMYRKNNKFGGMNRVVGRPVQDAKTKISKLGPKPTKIMLGKRLVRKCPSA